MTASAMAAGARSRSIRHFSPSRVTCVTAAPVWTEPTGKREAGEIEEVNPDEVLSILAPGGTIASSYTDHEARPQQSAMAQAVTSAFNQSAFLVVEAGTGVGKSLAYLVPGVNMRVRVHGGKVVVTCLACGHQRRYRVVRPVHGA